MVYALNEDILIGVFKLDVSHQPRPTHSLENMLSDLNFQKEQSFLPDLNAPEEPENIVEKVIPITAGPRIGRNDSCPCGSGKKHKKCCAKETS